MSGDKISFPVSEGVGSVSGLFLRPENARWLLMLAHGAGAGMHHPFMEGIAHALCDNGIATLRYQFPYMEQTKKSPDAGPVLLQTVRAAARTAREHGRGLPLFAGGKSLGGRMTSTAASQGELPDVQGIVFFGFPLHAPGKPSDARGEHLFRITSPLLFLQGTRDSLADLALLRPMVERLQKQTQAELHVIDGADHSFRVPKKAGRTEQEVWAELGRTAAEWAASVPSKSTADSRGS